MNARTTRAWSLGIFPVATIIDRPQLIRIKSLCHKTVDVGHQSTQGVFRTLGADAVLRTVAVLEIDGLAS